MRLPDVVYEEIEPFPASPRVRGWVLGPVSDGDASPSPAGPIRAPRDPLVGVGSGSYNRSSTGVIDTMETAEVHLPVESSLRLLFRDFRTAMISHEHRFIFLHISRTGGTNIRKTLTSREHRFPSKHEWAWQCFQRVPREVWGTYFKFSFVRNPWTRITSYYRWRSSKPWGVEAHGRSFQEWLGHVAECLRAGVPSSNAPGVSDFFIAINSQVDLLSIDDRIDFDFVGRFENLHGDFRHVCSRIGLEDRTLSRAKSRRRQRNDARLYNTSTKELVRSLYEEDIDYFKYGFPGS